MLIKANDPDILRIIFVPRVVQLFAGETDEISLITSRPCGVGYARAEVPRCLETRAHMTASLLASQLDLHLLTSLRRICGRINMSET
ncbi:hypothetical protein RU07_16170 [Agrobacterium tumefaciens]|uniref:Uncharacterized protein n=1 Tax=Agrobacterium tumefaciens TaxID=358 RepID=A0A0D0J642_AGRTU|nr:hypothetical protein RU07_16170 [Agrobacterium tumefaciens]